jgi:hypothetical protein
LSIQNYHYVKETSGSLARKASEETLSSAWSNVGHAGGGRIVLPDHDRSACLTIEGVDELKVTVEPGERHGKKYRIGSKQFEGLTTEASKRSGAKSSASDN